MRIRRSKTTEPWRLRRVASWSVLAVFGDPAMLLVPALALAGITMAVFALGAPGRPEVLVPAFAAPPADAFTDAGVIGHVERSTAATWAVRAALAILRGMTFGLVAALAVARAAGEAPSLSGAVRRIARRVPALAGTAGLAMGYAYTVSGGGRIEPGREAGVAGTALVAGMLFFPAAFVAAVADGRGIVGAIRRSGRWVLRRPLGHLGLVAGYAILFGGTLRLALFGEVARPRALPVTLYAFVAAFVTTMFTAALARRYALLYSDQVLASEHAAGLARRKERHLSRIARRGARRSGRGAPRSTEPEEAGNLPATGRRNQNGAAIPARRSKGPSGPPASGRTGSVRGGRTRKTAPNKPAQP